jgi:hypothetical protein
MGDWACLWFRGVHALLLKRARMVVLSVVLSDSLSVVLSDSLSVVLSDSLSVVLSDSLSDRTA